MNTLFRQFTAILGLTATLGLVSCQDKTLLSPDRPPVATGLDRLASPGYTLSKHGQATLTYQSDGRLQQATYAPGPVVYPANTVLYSYSFQSITARSYRGSVLVGIITFLTDNTGRCIESRHAWYGNSRTPVETAWTYAYNTLGQLVSRADKNSRVKINYTFDAAGDLSRAIIFDLTGMATKAINFTYSLHNPPGFNNPLADRPIDTPLLNDLSPLNADFSNLFYGIPPDPYQPNVIPPDPYLPNGIPPCLLLPAVLPPDPYLPIFGFSSNHLVQMITLNDIITNRVDYNGYFVYSFDTNGYVSQAREFNGATNALVATRLYGYLLPAVLVAK